MVFTCLHFVSSTQDKWRNMCISHGQCSRKKSKASRGKTISPVALSTLTTGNLVAEADAVDDISRSPRDVRDAPGYRFVLLHVIMISYNAYVNRKEEYRKTLEEIMFSGG